MRKLVLIQILLTTWFLAACQKQAEEVPTPIFSDVSLVTDDMADSLISSKLGFTKTFLPEQEIRELLNVKKISSFITSYKNEKTGEVYIISVPYNDASNVDVIITNNSEKRHVVRTLQLSERDFQVNPAAEIDGAITAKLQTSRGEGFFKRKDGESFVDCIDRVTKDFCDDLISRIAYETNVSIRILIAIECSGKQDQKQQPTEGAIQ
jgi:lipoprotein